MNTFSKQRNFFLINLAALSLFTTGCKVAGTSKRPTETPNQNVVMNYFSNTNFAIRLSGSFDLANAISGFSGLSMVGEAESSFTNWSSPPDRCIYTANDGLLFSPQRVIDVGDIQLFGSGVKLFEKSERHTYYTNGRLDAGRYSLDVAGVQGNLAYKQEFIVPEVASEIELTSGSYPPVLISSPDVPRPNDPGYLVTVNKTENLRIKFRAPRDADYARIQISDGSGQSEGEVVCFSPLDKEIFIPGEKLSYFRSTDDGILYIDFVSVSLRKDLEKIKESLVLSTVRHIHGTMDFNLNSHKETFRFGVLRFE